MAYGFILLALAGIGLIVTGFWGAYVYKGKRLHSNLLSLLMPLGLIVMLIGIVLTVLPNFFGETRW